jgi:cyanophycinase
VKELKRNERALIIVGGHEDKEDDKIILKEIARRTGSGKLVITTVASKQPADLWEQYEQIFRGLGVRHVYKLDVEEREDALSEKAVRVLDDTNTVFFTGGDQLKITSQLGCSPVCERLQEIYENGGTIAGTSAGASVVTETMMVEGDGESTHRIGEGLRLAPGLGFLRGVIVDQHFAERGRFGRLLAAVAQNPRILGVGLDENTAAIVERDSTFRVLGEGGVYIIDAGAITHSNIAEDDPHRALSIFDVKVHVLTQGDTYDCATRRPTFHPAEELEEELLGAS